MMILIWLIIGFGVYYFVTNADNDRKQKKENTAVDVLKQRYVNGEIDDVTYNKMLTVIKS